MTPKSKSSNDPVHFGFNFLWTEFSFGMFYGSAHFVLNMDLLHVDSSLHCNDWPMLSGLGAAAVSEGWGGKHLRLSHLGL